MSRQQIDAVFDQIGKRRHGLRDQVIFLLSVRAGLRAKEIASLTWAMVVDADEESNVTINLTNFASKGQSGRVIPINRQLHQTLRQHYQAVRTAGGSSFVVTTEQSDRTSAQAIVNLFYR